MPSKNSVKKYAADAFYHVYNRGVEKRPIFADERDFTYFTYLLDRYLVSPITQVALPEHTGKYKPKNYANKVQLAAYCLMPNHFHLLIKNVTERGMADFMHSIMISYVAYFNARHGKRVGPLFQGVYKGVSVESDELLIHDSRYVHLNPEDLGVDYKTYEYSSYQSYIGGHVPKWIHPELVLDLFAGNSYAEFVELQEKIGSFSRKDQIFSDFPEAAKVFREMLE